MSKTYKTKEEKIGLMLEQIEEALENINIKLDKLEKQKPIKKEKTDKEIMEQARKYLEHRRDTHSFNGIHKCLNDREWERLKKLMTK